MIKSIIDYVRSLVVWMQFFRRMSFLKLLYRSVVCSLMHAINSAVLQIIRVMKCYYAEFKYELLFFYLYDGCDYILIFSV